MKNTTLQKTVFVLLALLLVTVPVSAEMPMDKALDALQNYQFGESRLFETAIMEAVRDAHGDEQARAALAGKIAAALTEADSVDGKRFACRALGELGHPAAVEALAAHLSNDEMYDLANWALRQIQDEAATQALINSIDRLEGQQKLDAIYSLGFKGGADARRKLVQIVNAGRNREEMETALNALAAIRELHTGTGFVSIHSRIGDEYKDLLLTAMLDSAKNLLRESEFSIARRLFDDVYNDPDAERFHKVSALYGMVKTAPADSTELLLGVLRHEDPEMRRTAAKCIRMLVDPDALEAFSGVLDSLDVETQKQVLQALADRGERVGEIALQTATTAENEELKLTAIAALGRAGTADALEPLLLWAADGNTDLGRAARAALASLPAEVDGEIVAELADAEEKRADLLLRTLVERNAKTVAPQLLELAAADNTAHSNAILRALEALATPDQFGPVLAMLHTVDADSLRNVERILISLGQKLGDPADSLLQAAGGENPEALRVSAIRVLAGIGQMNAEPVYRQTLERHLDAENEEIRSTAIRALGDWPTREALPVLLSAAQKASGAAQKDELFDAVLTLVSKSQVLVAPPEGANDELLYTRRLSLAPEPMGPHEAFSILETIAQNTGSSGLRKKVLSALANVTLPEALALAESFANRPGLKPEAHSAMLSIARHVAGADRDAATAALQKILAEGEHDFHKNQAQETLNLLDATGDYIMAWRVSGPYAVGEGGHTVHFQDIMPTVLPQPHPFVMNFLETLGGFVRRAYIVTNLHAETAQDAILELGSDDGVIVWLNGKQVHEYPEGRELIPGEDKIPHSLKAGDNILKILVHQKASHWHACARLTDTDGNPIQGVTPKLPPPGEY